MKLNAAHKHDVSKMKSNHCHQRKLNSETVRIKKLGSVRKYRQYSKEKVVDILKTSSKEADLSESIN